MLGKLDIVREHIHASIQMIAVECNAFSTHTVVMACRELVTNIAAKRGVGLDWDYRIWIKDEHHTEFRKLSYKAYNYFKHADWDADKTYDGPKTGDLVNLNEVQTLLNIDGYKQIGGIATQPMILFGCTMMITHPNFFRLEFMDAFPALKSQYANLDRDRETSVAALRYMLRQAGSLPIDDAA